jgi:hypothetical protein
LPEGFQDGDEIEVAIVPIRREAYPFPVFDLGIKDDYLEQEHIYATDSSLS